jgi:hypothetical protein
MAKQDFQKNKEEILKEIETLLNQQTLVILSAVDERIERAKNEMKLEINNWLNTLDKFLKQLTDFNDEFQKMKARMGKIEEILKEKLGVKVE